VVVKFAQVAAEAAPGPRVGSQGEPAQLFDLLDLSERARLNGNFEQSDRLLLMAWAAYEEPMFQDGTPLAGRCTGQRPCEETWAIMEGQWRSSPAVASIAISG
jgi:hypothetical protein